MTDRIVIYSSITVSALYLAEPGQDCDEALAACLEACHGIEDDDFLVAIRLPEEIALRAVRPATQLLLAEARRLGQLLFEGVGAIGQGGDLATTYEQAIDLEQRFKAAAAGMPGLSLDPSKVAARRAYHAAEIAPLERLARASYTALTGRRLRRDDHPFNSLLNEFGPDGTPLPPVDRPSSYGIDG